MKLYQNSYHYLQTLKRNNYIGVLLDVYMTSSLTSYHYSPYSTFLHYDIPLIPLPNTIQVTLRFHGDTTVTLTSTLQ